MKKVVLDAATGGRRAKIIQCVELFNESGQSLGHFIPAIDPQLYRDVEIPFTEEELAAAESEAIAYSTAEVIRRLGEAS